VPPAIEAKRPLVVQCHGSIGQIADHDPIAGKATENLLVRLIERDVLAVGAARSAEMLRLCTRPGRRRRFLNRRTRASAA
jgi:hypothetical protein